MSRTVSSFATQYSELLRLLVTGEREDGVEHAGHERTREQVSFLPEGWDFNVPIEDTLPTVSNRLTDPHVAAVEAMWTLTGTEDVHMLHALGVTTWAHLTISNGAGRDLVENAYGSRYRKEFGRDQIAAAYQHLRLESSSRQVWVSAWDPSIDGLGDLRVGRQLHVPATVGFSLSLHDGKCAHLGEVQRLNSTLMLRAIDVFARLPYEVMAHAFMLDAIARTIDRKTVVQNLRVTIAQPYMYMAHGVEAAESLECEQNYLRAYMQPWLDMPGYSIGDIKDDPGGYLKEVEELVRDTHYPTYNCDPEVFV